MSCVCVVLCRLVLSYGCRMIVLCVALCCVVLCCVVLCCVVLSCLGLSWLVLACLVLSWPALSGPELYCRTSWIIFKRAFRLHVSTFNSREVNQTDLPLFFWSNDNKRWCQRWPWVTFRFSGDVWTCLSHQRKENGNCCAGYAREGAGEGDNIIQDKARQDKTDGWRGERCVEDSFSSRNS